MILTYKYRIKDKSARKALRAYAYAANQVWNWLVAQQRDTQARYAAGAPNRRWPTYFTLDKACNGAGAELGLLQESVSAVCQQFVRSRDQHKRCPKFRSSFGKNRALGWVPFKGGNVRIQDDAAHYRGKQFRFWVGGRPAPAANRGGAFIEDTRGRWYLAIQVEAPERDRAVAGMVGIDLGLKALATTSNGEVIENLRHVQRHAERLAIAQRAGNQRRVRSIHAKIANCRRDHHHKISTRLAREYAFIAVGNVNAKALAKTRMAKSVLDAGWSTFRTMLAYKAAHYLEVDERFTTQTCSSCGALPPGRPEGIAGLGIRAWRCSVCGADHDRDVNAARNIAMRARSSSRLAEEIRCAPSEGSIRFDGARSIGGINSTDNRAKAGNP